jgi:hypothetical protein
MLVVFLGVLKQPLLLGGALMSMDDWAPTNSSVVMLLLASVICKDSFTMG